MSIYDGEFGEPGQFMSYINEYRQHYAALRLSDQFHTSARASDERVRHAVSWIDWGFYVSEWYILHHDRSEEM